MQNKNLFELGLRVEEGDIQMNVKIQQNALVQKMGDIYHYYIAINLLLKNSSVPKLCPKNDQL